jgi:hypothetical protein
MRPSHDFHTTVSCGAVPEESHLIFTSTFIFKVLSSTGDGRGDLFSSRNFSVTTRLVARSEEHLADYAMVSKVPNAKKGMRFP